MDYSGKIKISDAKDLYSILPEEFRQEFAIGMHEFREVAGAPGRPLELTGKWDENRVEMVKKSILSQGLKFDEDSILLSTVMFDENSFGKYVSGENKLGGVIVALPKVLRSESGEEMFVGQPNEDGMFRDRYDYNQMRYKGWDRRTEATSLSEIITPDSGVLNPMFIIGTYSKTDKGIEISLNPEHIAFKNGKVPDAFFKQKKDKLSEVVGNLGKFALKETLSQQQRYKGKNDFTLDIRKALSKLVDEEMTYVSNVGIDGISKDDVRDFIEYVRCAGLDEKADTVQKFFETMYYRNSEYTGHSSEMHDAISMSTEEKMQDLESTQISAIQESTTDKTVISLKELGKKSYQHFGNRISEKLKQIVNALKNKKDKNKTEDLTNGR